MFVQKLLYHAEYVNADLFTASGKDAAGGAWRNIYSASPLIIIIKLLFFYLNQDLKYYYCRCSKMSAGKTQLHKNRETLSNCRLLQVVVQICSQ